MTNGQYNAISFYVFAHEDDWQLFMNLNAFYDLMDPGVKVVFIHTTAGDAGLDPIYWQAREEGSKSSIRFCLASRFSPVPPAPGWSLSESSGTRNFNGHVINYWSTNNATCYFMRLPDGKPDGSGFPAFGFQSIGKLKIGQIPTITAVDNSAHYNGWSDFCNTIQAIIQVEANGFQRPWINLPDTNTTINPGDHSDHVTTGQAVQAMEIISSFQQALFIDYALSSFPPDLTGADFFWKSGMFAAYVKAVYDRCGYSTLSEEADPSGYIGYCSRNVHYRTA